MSWRQRGISTLLLLLAACAAQAQPPVQVLEWAALRPEPTPEVDVFAALSDEQQAGLVRLVRIEALRAAGHADPAQLDAERQRLTQSLTAQGLDVAGLLTERQRVIERRRAMAETTNPAFDGVVAQISGYLLPTGFVAAPDGSVAALNYFLVPQPGVCSHTAPPLPNQIVRISVHPQAALRDPRQPVRVSGSFKVAPQTRAVHVVDGVMLVTSGYEMRDAVIKTLGPATFALPLRMR